MGTFIVGGLLLVVVAIIIRGMIRKKKNGESVQCGCSCKDCGGSCH